MALVLSFICKTTMTKREKSIRIWVTLAGAWIFIIVMRVLGNWFGLSDNAHHALALFGMALVAVCSLLIIRYSLGKCPNCNYPIYMRKYKKGPFSHEMSVAMPAKQCNSCGAAIE